MSREKRLSAAEAAALRAEVDHISRRLEAILRRLPPPEDGDDDVSRRTVRMRRRDDEIPELTVRTTARLVGVSESTVRTKVHAGELEHRRTPRGHLRISGRAFLRWYDERNGAPPD